MGNRGINSSKPCVSHQRNLAYLKSRAAQKFWFRNCLVCQSLHRAGAEALQNCGAEKHMKQHNSMQKPFKAKALLAIAAQPLATPDSSPRLTNGSKRSLRSLGRAKARPLTKR